ncbi:hypothetical protein OPW57_00050 [Vibrio europaeus]|nr:hypothetical protein [Vibrio europaeus]
MNTPSTSEAFNIAKIGHVCIYIAITSIAWFTWPVTSQLNMSQLQPIASTVATISGILFGFAMGSMTLLANSSNRLVSNSRRIGYLDKLTGKLHNTMGWLLAVCIVFLTTMFVPDVYTIEIGNDPIKTYKIACIIGHVGVTLLLIALKHFFFTWKEFKVFAKHM